MNRIADPETSEDDGLWKLMVKGLPDDPFMPLHLAQAWGLVEPHHNYWMDRAGYAPGNAGAKSTGTSSTPCLRKRRKTNGKSRPSRTGPSSASTPRPPAMWTMPFHRSPARRRLEPDAGAGLPGLPLAVRGEAGQGRLQPRHQHLSAGSHPSHASGSLGTGAYSLLSQKTRPSLLIECTVGADGLVTLRTARRYARPCGEPVL